MTVETFMRRALYEPGAGYYSARIETVGGKRADFSTGATIAPWLGRAIATWILESSRTDKICNVIEIGAGSGALAESVLKTLGFWQGRRLRYQIVDISPPLVALQRKRLSRFRQITWAESLPEALAHAGGRAILFSNELFDAFPCRRLEWDGIQWLETTLARDPGGVWRESLGSIPFDEREFQLPKTPWPFELKPGHRIEIQRSIWQWLNEWAPHWKAGRMLSIDYGELFPEVYRRSPRGSLRGYFRQSQVTGEEVFARPGHQDMTVDVNFSDLIRWGEALGWPTSMYASQRDFLFRYAPGIEKAKDDASKFLLASDGMGSAFQTLVQVCRS